MNPYLLISIKQTCMPSILTFDYDLVHSLMRKLPHRLKIICALEAAKLVLPIWEQYTKFIPENKMTKEEKKVPKKTIETIEKWLEGQATEDEVQAAGKASGLVAAIFSGGVRHSVGYSAASSGASVAYTVIDGAKQNYYGATNAVSHATNAADATANTTLYTTWWRKCYSLIKKELQNQYDVLCKSINGEV